MKRLFEQKKLPLPASYLDSGQIIYGLTDYEIAQKADPARGNIECVQAMLDGGIRLIQYREKERKMGVMLEECRAIRALTRDAGALFIINDHPSLVMLCEADGIHSGQDDLPVQELRALLGPDKIIGMSTHSPDQAAKAISDGADYIGVGPIFATKTKKDVCEPVGLEYLEHVVKTHKIPFVAIGGIKAENIQTVREHGASCCAVVSGIVGAKDMLAAIKELG